MFIRAIAPLEFAIEERNYYVREARCLEDTGREVGRLDLHRIAVTFTASTRNRCVPSRNCITIRGRYIPNIFSSVRSEPTCLLILNLK